MARRQRGEPKPGEIGPPKPARIGIKEFHLNRFKALRERPRMMQPEDEEPVPLVKRVPYRKRPRPRVEYD